MKRLLIIAGSDSSAGAGLQADLKTTTALGVYGMTVVTAVTSQNTKGVHDILFVPEEHVRSQLEAVASDIPFDAVKIGMLGTAETAAVVEEFVRAVSVPVVLDPVMVAQSGGRLSPGTIFGKLADLADLITPNAEEAGVLAGMTVRTAADMETAARKLMKRFGAILIKGGDTASGIDVYGDGRRIERLPIRRIETRNNHGSGCTLATAIAALIAKGEDMATAIRTAREFVRLSLMGGVPLGADFGTLNQFAAVDKERMRHTTLQMLHDAAMHLKGQSVGRLIPEIQSNFVYLLPFAEQFADVAGFPGRIIRVGDEIHVPFYPAFGASRHMASVVLAAHRRFPSIRAAMNIRYAPELVTLLRKQGYIVGSFDRSKEPRAVRIREGSSLDWGVTDACGRMRKAPDMIFDTGGPGKEPVIRVFGADPFDVAEKIRILAAAVRSGERRS